MTRYITIMFCICLLSCHTERGEDYLPYYNSADFTPQWLTKKEAATKKLHQIPAFSFIDQSGNTITEQTVAGKIYIANFFFTSCPGICKRLTNGVKLVQDAFTGNTGVLILSHSVTPETDSVAALQAYAQQYGINAAQWHLLTGNRSALYSIARSSYFADEDLGLQQGENDFLHTENVILIDRNRRIRGIYKGSSETEMKHLITDIYRLMEEE